MCFKVLSSISNILAHAWSVKLAQAVLGSSCLVLEMMTRSLDRSEMSSYLIVGWALHSELISSEVGCAIPEPVEPFMGEAPPLFLRSSEIIHSKCDTLQFRVFIRILEIHDFNLPNDSEGDSTSGGDSSEEDYLGYDPGRGLLQPWPRVYRPTSRSSPAWDPWPSLPSAGGGASWHVMVPGSVGLHPHGHRPLLHEVAPFELATWAQLPPSTCEVQFESGEHASVVSLILSTTAMPPEVLPVKEAPTGCPMVA
jgi:hypothetical protein